MTIAQARLLLLDAARNANADQNNSTNLDYAIQAAGNEFVSRTKCVMSYDTVVILSPTEIITSGSFAGDFRPDRLLRAWVSNEVEDLQVIDFREIQRMHQNDSSEGVPTHIGFSSANDDAAMVWRVPPSPGYTLEYQYHAPFTVYTAGGDGSAELNIPEDMIRPVIQCGAVYYLLKNMPENAAWVDRCRRDFEAHIEQNKYRASTGVRSAPRAMME